MAHLEIADFGPSRGGNRLKTLLVMVLTIFSAGCAGQFGEGLLAPYPTYRETSEAWSPLAEDRGRAIFYFVEQEGLGLFGEPMVPITIDKDRELRAALTEGSFVFVDLEAGEHTVTYQCDAMGKRKVKAFDVAAAEYVYVKLDRRKSDSELAFTVVEQEEGLRDLQDLRHNFKKPLSIYYQRKPRF